jgi:predicted transcriptional regulator
MIENDGRGKLEEKRVTDLIRERGERFHRRGRKPKSPESQRLSKNALRLLRHILKVTSKEDPIWSESVEEVAKGLGIDPSTVKRLRRRLCEVGVVVPQEKKGGRGKTAQYQVDLEKAETLVREGVWGAAKKGGEKGAQKPGQEPKPAQEIPAPKPPFFSRCGRTRAAQTAHSGGGRPARPCHSFA